MFRRTLWLATGTWHARGSITNSPGALAI